jgi:hypothetical protein
MRPAITLSTLVNTPVGDAPDRTLIGLTVAGAVGGVGLLAASLPAAPLFQLLGELSFSAFLQVVVFTTALYVARKLSIEILVAILAAVAMFYHPLARGFVDISPGFALFPAGLLLLSRRWPGFWRDEAAAPKEAAREVTARESGAAHAVSRSIPPSPGARAGATPVTPRTGASTDAGGAQSREDPREATHQTREPGGGGRSPAA